MKRFIKILEVIALIIGIACIIWFAVSFFDVLAYQNCGGTPHIWNVFNLPKLD